MIKPNRKLINKNSKVAWQQSINLIAEDQYKRGKRDQLKEERKEKKLDIDKYNRFYIVNKILEYMEVENYEKEEAIKKVMEEEPEKVKYFEYLERAGLDLEKVFSNWVNGKSKKRNVKLHEIEEGER